MKPVVIAEIHFFPPRDRATPNDDTLPEIMHRVIGETPQGVVIDLNSAITPSFMKDSAIPGNYIPVSMLREYDQIYRLSDIPHWM